ncbi:hypothetical protein [Zunongwangia sp.]|uniref:hypothetical protein n=1 Tax=Zunongwangia sp. TaxID=1965325 RepID=UPI003AA98683
MAVGKVIDRVGWGNSGDINIPDSLLEDIENLKKTDNKTIALGNIGNTLVEKAFNTKALEHFQAYSEGFHIPATGYVKVTATQNEKPVIWLFTGKSGHYEGNLLKADANDFTRVSFDGEVDLKAIKDALGDQPVLAGGNLTDTAKTLRDDVNIKPTIVSTVNVLKSYSGTVKQGQLFQTIGFSDTVDIGGANYVYNQNLNSFDEITTFKSNNLAGGFSLKINEKFLNVAQLGANGQNDADIIERAIAVSGGNIYVPIDIHIERQINVTTSFRVLCYGDIKDGGLNNKIFNFEPEDGDDNETIDIKVEGFSKFKDSSSPFYVSRNVNLVSFSNLNFDACLNGITFVNQTGESYFGKRFRMTNCYFSNSENGLYSFMYDWDNVEVLGGGADNMSTDGSIELNNRSHPMSKGDINGIYIRNTTKDNMNVSILGFHAKNIINTTPAATYTETHGIAVALSDDTQTDVIIANCNVKNITGERLDGVEGIMGRGRRVILDVLTALDAGGTEGCIYCKGSRYHKVSNTTIEVSSDNPRRHLIRGFISTGSNCDINSVKLINLRYGIYLRSPKSSISDVDWINVDTGVQLQIEDGVQHEFTKILGGTCDGHAATDFLYQGAVANGASYGEITIDNLKFKGNRIAVLTQCESVSISNKCSIDRHENAASRDLIEFGGGLIGELEFSLNRVKNFQRVGGDGRILTGNDNTPKIKFIGNTKIKNGHSALRLRDRSNPYEQIIIKDNNFDESVDYPIFGDYNVNYTVSGDYIVKDNIGLKDADRIKEIKLSDILSGNYTIKPEDRNMFLLFTVVVNNVIFNSTSGVYKGAEYQGKFAASEATIIGNDALTLEYPNTLTAVYAQKGVFGIKAESSTVLALAGHQKTV